MMVLRSLLYAVIFYPATAVLATAGMVAALFGRAPMLAVILGWARLNHWLAERLLGIRTEVVGAFPPGAHLIAVKHQSLFETTEMFRLENLPVVVIKQELAAIPVFGSLTRRYGVISVERSAGARALRALVKEGKTALSSGRSVIIYPEGTRVRPGHTPPLKPGFAALYRALGLPVVPVAVNSGRLWGSGLVKRSGTITFLIGRPIEPGLSRGAIETQVHAAINALELAAEPGA